LIGNSEGKTLIGRPRSRSEDNIKMDIKEIGFWAVDWINLVQDGIHM
jgi:hypothetical protein